MKDFEEAGLLRVYIGERDSAHGGEPTHLRILHMARELGLAGATVLHGSQGYHHGGRLHDAGILRLAEELPVIVEVVDKEARLLEFVGQIRPLIRSGCITMQSVSWLEVKPNNSQS